MSSAVQWVLSEGVDFAGIQLAVTAPEGDSLPQLLEEYIGKMQDISSYCTVTAMEEDEALTALEQGEVTAVLRLPENFVQGVMWGDNPDVQVVVGSDQPLAALLTLWVGQSACDILTAVQTGIYAVLEVYDAAPAVDLVRDQVVQDINLKYVVWAVNRQSIFRISEISATGTIPVKEHYAACLLVYFSLALAPFFTPIYREDWLRSQRRLRAVGRSGLGGYVTSVLASAVILLLFLLPGMLLTARNVSLPLLGVALAAAVLAAVFASFCCLLTGSAAGCGMLAFLVALVALALAGGILPPILLPQTLQKLSGISPVTWLVGLAGRAMGYETECRWLLPGVVTVVMAAGSCRLYCLKLDGKGATE